MKARYEFGSDDEYRAYLRVYFAGCALRGILANPYYRSAEEFVARDILNVADAMVAELFGENHNGGGQ